MNTENVSIASIWSGHLYPENASFPAHVLAENLCAIAANSHYAPPESDTKQFLEVAQQKSTMLTKYGLILAIRDNLIAGFLEARVVDDIAEIDFVAVSSEQQRKGIGRILVSFAIEAAEHFGAEKILLEVGRENKSANSLYTKLGFKQIATRKNYYKGTEDALILEYLIKQTSQL
jgi:ribosomal protein S18 acetylase RimI-like enzyme